jgi:hypothetical protein
MKANEIADLMKNAELDQLASGLMTLAKATRIYFLELRDQGFSAKESLDLTKHWQTNLFSQARDDK